ncbi:nicotinate (nicotinamide) nucleotide adenylyltransferase [Ruminococcaceae bacterium OttesenSCG-928-A16]|nr:nicotinate (nicotinamide) nucleotide adenylyltransferase [Ruminococcaceae bacterium OttesenSCG-928-A16]
MKLLLFGGTFDPPHTGHISLLSQAIKAVNPTEVWVMPAGLPPHKQASATPAALRLQMCACFKPLFSNMVISDWEMQQQGKSYTLNTVQWLLAQNPGAVIYLCIGSDMLLSFTTWHEWQQLLQLVVLVAQNRTPQHAAKLQAAAKALQHYGANILFTNGEVEEISSTWLREEIGAGRDIAGLIPPPADEIIKQNKLYQNNGDSDK